MAWLRSLSGGIRPYANKRFILPVLALFILILAVLEASPIGEMRLKALSGGQGMLDMQFGYTAPHAYAMLGAIGEGGRRLYEQLLGLDYLFTVVYAALQTLLITALLRKAGVTGRLSMLNLIPFARCLLDIVENTLLMYVLARFPVQHASLVAVCSGVTMVKLALNYGYMGMMFLLGALSSRGTVATLRRTRDGKAVRS